jgi:2'-5' RNA ligase
VQVGSTLVYELPHPLPEALNRFRERVDAALGEGYYAWFDPSALHVTVRGL